MRARVFQTAIVAIASSRESTAETFSGRESRPGEAGADVE